MDYSLLTNSTYLYLLKNPEAEINFSAIGKIIGKTRQTVSKEYQYLIKNDIDYTQNIFNIQEFYLDVTSSIERALCIYLTIKGPVVADQICQDLKISRNAVFQYLQNAKKRIGLINEEAVSTGGVYVALFDNEIIYVGSSQNIDARILSHKKNLKSPPSVNDLKFYKYCKQNNISADKISFIPLIYTKDYLLIEKEMIKTIQPICNVMSK